MPLIVNHLGHIEKDCPICARWHKLPEHVRQRLIQPVAGRITRSALRPAAMRRVKAQPPSISPGAELMAAFKEVGVTDKVGCRCKEIAAWMDRLGVDGCKREKPAILQRLRQQKALYSRWEKAWAAWKAVPLVLSFQLNPLNPLDSLVDEAIRRTEVKEAKAKVRATPPSVPAVPAAPVVTSAATSNNPPT